MSVRIKAGRRRPAALFCALAAVTNVARSSLAIESRVIEDDESTHTTRDHSDIDWPDWTMLIVDVIYPECPGNSIARCT